MSRDARADRKAKRRRQQRNAAWAERTAPARVGKLLRRLYAPKAVRKLWRVITRVHPFVRAVVKFPLSYEVKL